MAKRDTYIEIPVTVEYTYSQAWRGARDSYGCPLEPDEDESIQIDAVMLKDNNIIDELTKEDVYALEQEIWTYLKD